MGRREGYFKTPLLFGLTTFQSSKFNQETRFLRGIYSLVKKKSKNEKEKERAREMNSKTMKLSFGISVGSRRSQAHSHSKPYTLRIKT